MYNDMAKTEQKFPNWKSQGGCNMPYLTSRKFFTCFGKCDMHRVYVDFWTQFLVTVLAFSRVMPKKCQITKELCKSIKFECQRKNIANNYTLWFANAFISGMPDLGSNLGPVKLDTELPTARHGCYVSSKEAVLPGAMTRRWAPLIRYTLRRSTVNIIKDESWFARFFSYIWHFLDWLSNK